MSADSPKHDSQLLTAVLQIQEDIAVIKTQQAETTRRLFGNGQPGLVDRLDDRIKSLELKDAQDTGKQDSNHRWTAAIASVVSGVVSVIVAWIFKTLTHGK